MVSIKWPDGKITCPKCDGDKVGEIRYEQGKVINETRLYRGLKIERRVKSNADGRPLQEFSIQQVEGEQIMHGPFRSYHDDGALAESGSYLRGARDGTWHKYDSDGKLIGEVLYKNGIEQ